VAEVFFGLNALLVTQPVSSKYWRTHEIFKSVVARHDRFIHPLYRTLGITGSAPFTPTPVLPQLNFRFMKLSVNELIE